MIKLNLNKQDPVLKVWTAEPAGSDLEHDTDIVLRLTLPDGGNYCHRYALNTGHGEGYALAEMQGAIEEMEKMLGAIMLQRSVE